jgi:hypothetical protein
VPSGLQHETGNGRVQVPVFVAIDVVKAKTGGGESIELCGDFGGHLPAYLRIQKNPDARGEHAIMKIAGPIDQIWHPRRRRHRAAIDQHDVETHPQTRQPQRPLHSIGGRRRAHHEASSGQNTASMGNFDGFVDFGREAEVVRRYDQILQFADPLPICAQRKGLRLKLVRVHNPGRRLYGITMAVPFDRVAKKTGNKDHERQRVAHWPPPEELPAPMKNTVDPKLKNKAARQRGGDENKGGGRKPGQQGAEHGEWQRMRYRRASITERIDGADCPGPAQFVTE